MTVKNCKILNSAFLNFYIVILISCICILNYLELRNSVWGNLTSVFGKSIFTEHGGNRANFEIKFPRLRRKLISKFAVSQFKVNNVFTLSVLPQGTT